MFPGHPESGRIAPESEPLDFVDLAAGVGFFLDIIIFIVNAVIILVIFSELVDKVLLGHTFRDLIAYVDALPLFEDRLLVYDDQFGIVLAEEDCGVVHR